jgi:hypothetical protein
LQEQKTIERARISRHPEEVRLRLLEKMIRASFLMAGHIVPPGFSRGRHQTTRGRSLSGHLASLIEDQYLVDTALD